MNYTFPRCNVWKLPSGAPAGAPALPGGVTISRDDLADRWSSSGSTPFLGIDECQWHRRRPLRASGRRTATGTGPLAGAADSRGTTCRGAEPDEHLVQRRTTTTTRGARARTLHGLRRLGQPRSTRSRASPRSPTGREPVADERGPRKILERTHRRSSAATSAPTVASTSPGRPTPAPVIGRLMTFGRRARQGAGRSTSRPW